MKVFILIRLQLGVTKVRCIIIYVKIYQFRKWCPMDVPPPPPTTTATIKLAATDFRNIFIKTPGVRILKFVQFSD